MSADDRYVRSCINDFLDALEKDDPDLFRHTSWLSKYLNRKDFTNENENEMAVICHDGIIMLKFRKEWGSRVLRPLGTYQGTYLHRYRPFAKEVYEAIKKRISESEFSKKVTKRPPRSPSWRPRTRSRSPDRSRRSAQSTR